MDAADTSVRLYAARHFDAGKKAAVQALFSLTKRRIKSVDSTFRIMKFNQGFRFQKEIYQIFSLPEGEEMIRLMTFKNIKINEASDNLEDSFKLPLDNESSAGTDGK